MLMTIVGAKLAKIAIRFSVTSGKSRLYHDAVVSASHGLSEIRLMWRPVGSRVSEIALGDRQLSG